jgi:hypothetical protein
MFEFSKSRKNLYCCEPEKPYLAQILSYEFRYSRSSRTFATSKVPQKPSSRNLRGQRKFAKLYAIYQTTYLLSKLVEPVFILDIA